MPKQKYLDMSNPAKWIKSPRRAICPHVGISYRALGVLAEMRKKDYQPHEKIFLEDVLRCLFRGSYYLSKEVLTEMKNQELITENIDGSYAMSEKGVHVLDLALSRIKANTKDNDPFIRSGYEMAAIKIKTLESLVSVLYAVALESRRYVELVAEYTEARNAGAEMRECELKLKELQELALS